MGNRIAGAMNNVAQNRGNVPILKLVLGILLLGFFVLALMMDVQTSEAFILNGGKVAVQSLNWTILRQPIDLAQGNLPMDTAKAVMWGWGCLLIYLVCVIGETTIHGRLGGIFKTVAFIIVAFDFWTNVNYGTLPSGMGGQVGFAVITSFIVAFFGVLGLNLIFSAITEMTR